MEVSRVAFGSCIKPDNLVDYPESTGDTVWKHVRRYKPDLFLWLGDNAYDVIDTFSDTSNIWDKGTIRMKYNEVRETPSYVKYGLVAEESGRKIPIMGTWDDHDAGTTDNGGSNEGKYESCLMLNQDEFVIHLNVPKSEPMHQEYPSTRQHGVYNSRMFLIPETKKPGIHTIMLDVRSGRDDTTKVCWFSCIMCYYKYNGPYEEGLHKPYIYIL